MDGHGNEVKDDEDTGDDNEDDAVGENNSGERPAWDASEGDRGNRSLNFLSLCGILGSEIGRACGTANSSPSCFCVFVTFCI